MVRKVLTFVGAGVVILVSLLIWINTMVHRHHVNTYVMPKAKLIAAEGTWEVIHRDVHFNHEQRPCAILLVVETSRGIREVLWFSARGNELQTKSLLLERWLQVTPMDSVRFDFFRSRHTTQDEVAEFLEPRIMRRTAKEEAEFLIPRQLL
jgi:hypothetical protein